MGEERGGKGGEAPQFTFLVYATEFSSCKIRRYAYQHIRLLGTVRKAATGGVYVGGHSYSVGVIPVIHREGDITRRGPSLSDYATDRRRRPRRPSRSVVSHAEIIVGPRTLRFKRCSFSRRQFLLSARARSLHQRANLGRRRRTRATRHISMERATSSTVHTAALLRAST